MATRKQSLKPQTVEAYIAAMPRELQPKLRALRAVIRKAAPGAKERISYGMPYYELNGRLAYFRLSKNHIGLYIPSPVIEEYEKELRRYDTSKATIRFPLDQKLPTALIKKLVRSRLKRNISNRENPTTR